MQATIVYAAGDVRVETVPDATIKAPTDALVRVVGGVICGSDLWPYGSMNSTEPPHRMGHEFIGVVEATVSDARTVRAHEFGQGRQLAGAPDQFE